MDKKIFPISCFQRFGKHRWNKD